jgi:hypothetical protein
VPTRPDLPVFSELKIIKTPPSCLDKKSAMGYWIVGYCLPSTEFMVGLTAQSDKIRPVHIGRIEVRER